MVFLFMILHFYNPHLGMEDVFRSNGLAKLLSQKFVCKHLKIISQPFVLLSGVLPEFLFWLDY
jgi:hypothetical protein